MAQLFAEPMRSLFIINSKSGPPISFLPLVHRYLAPKHHLIVFVAIPIIIRYNELVSEVTQTDGLGNNNDFADIRNLHSTNLSTQI